MAPKAKTKRKATKRHKKGAQVSSLPLSSESGSNSSSKEVLDTKEEPSRDAASKTASESPQKKNPVTVLSQEDASGTVEEPKEKKRPFFLKKKTPKKSKKKVRKRYQAAQILKLALRVLIALVFLGLVALLAFLFIRNSSYFEITDINIQPTEHVTAEDIGNLLEVPAGATLLNVDLESVETSLKRNAWVESLEAELQFPHTLNLTITEKSVYALVLPDSGNIAWYLSDSGTWIEPVRIETAEEQSVKEAALQRSISEGCLLISDAPSTLEYASGAVVESEELDAVFTFMSELSAEFTDNIVSFSAAVPNDIVATLSSGVEIYFGDTSDIAEKEQIVRAYLEKHPDNLLYINVKVVSNPTVRTSS